MTELLTAAQMRAIEQAAIDAGDVTGLELMERAGQGVVEAVFEEWPELAEGGNRAVVLCGPGNNGGDGFVVARLLAERGWDVQVFLYGDANKLPPDARVNYDRWLELGEVKLFEARSFANQPWYDLRVDALFGSGLRRPISRDVLDAMIASLRWENGGENVTSQKRIAVDCPSCVEIDSGRPMYEGGDWVGDVDMDFYADVTVTFHSLKVGHLLQGDWDFSRKVIVKSIGLEDEESAITHEIVKLIEAPVEPLEISEKSLEKFENEHKFIHGHALILSGGFGKTGAARLAARGALRIGAGLVTLGVPGAAQMEVAGQITGLMMQRIEDADGLAEALEDRRISALCLGPGLGVDRARALVPVAVRDKCAPYVVLDADALTGFADDPDALFAILHDKCVLTPHGGEFARLFPDLAEKLNAPATKGPAYSKVDATREAAARAGCVVLFKGPDTVIASPDGRCSINSAHYDRAAPWLATAGSGDVLAGFITGLLARGFDPMQAAESAAWLHVECARSFGPGLIAEDLPEELPKVLRGLGL